MRICRHFSQCGGCSFQDIPYEDQLKIKAKKIRELASRYNIKTDILPVNSYNLMHYRGKMEFTFSKSDGLVCGLHNKTKKRQVLDIEECLIFSPDTGRILEAVRRFCRERKYSVYNKYSHKGFLRNLILKETKFGKELMVGIVTTSEDNFDEEGFLQCMLSLKLSSPVKSIYRIINDSLSDAVVFQEKKLLFGKEFIRENILGFNFRIGIDTFFQVNSFAAGDFFKKIREYTSLDKGKSVLDIFCGSGIIGIFLAPEAKFVWGVEVSKEIVGVAWQNAHINRIKNVSFFASDARRFLNNEGSFYKNIDLLVINPPRSGLSKRIIRAVLRLKPKEIFYSSCNPDAFCRDISCLRDKYALRFIEPFDFFPHTPHMECFGPLRRSDNIS
ncbi:MAG: 23S rRNA (uracil(1939)-C(5))-methyltransferase RlmD [Candidatus Omnitrophica bacterium]|nr:23S rRNA (uracil(1939)-C(5))-methyltransferase RlmD [Candidatus Omnitrophota bacterium]MBD3269459.1 23S rRNA (uracil(1939)-C(5))-methyltransferase RlmD [Candidatus Omnitrophota bacterium]